MAVNKPKKLTIDLVPSTCWFSNLRSELPPEDWKRLRLAQRSKDRYRCQGCGVFKDKGLHCHERWEYTIEEFRRIQRLAGLMTLCRECHAVKHMGFAAINGKGDETIQHFMDVNGLTDAEAQERIADAFKEWDHRSKFKWDLDISWLEGRISESYRKVAAASKKRAEQVKAAREAEANKALALMEMRLGPTPKGKIRVAGSFSCGHAVATEITDPDTLEPDAAGSMMLALATLWENPCPGCEDLQESGAKTPPMSSVLSVHGAPGPSGGSTPTDAITAGLTPSIIDPDEEPEKPKGKIRRRPKTVEDDEGREYEWC